MAGNRKNFDLRKTYVSRRKAAFKLAKKQNAVGALLISNAVDVEYLTGFDGGDSYLLIGDRWATLLTDGRYTEQAADQTNGIDVLTRTGAMTEAIALALKGKNVRSVGFQAAHITVKFQQLMQKALGKKKLHPLSGMVSQLRQVKTDHELKLMKKAVRIAENAFKELTGRGAKYWIGKTERQIAAELEFLMVCSGAEKASFETIVAAGPTGSMPHYRPSNKKLRNGQAVLIDWGAKHAGYCSDLTRVVFIGRIPRQISDIYDIVNDAHIAAAKAIRPGVSSPKVDSVARGVIADAGYGDKFVHSLGHGLGKEVHELPALASSYKMNLKKGNVVTVEPGIYLPRVGGVRLEDDYVVTSTGAERLGTLGRKKTDMILD